MAFFLCSFCVALLLCHHLYLLPSVYVAFFYHLSILPCFCVRVETESGGTRRRTGGEVKGKEANGVGRQQSSA